MSPKNSIGQTSLLAWRLLKGGEIFILADKNPSTFTMHAANTIGKNRNWLEVRGVRRWVWKRGRLLLTCTSKPLSNIKGQHATSFQKVFVCTARATYGAQASQWHGGTRSSQCQNPLTLPYLLLNHLLCSTSPIWKLAGGSRGAQPALPTQNRTSNSALLLALCCFPLSRKALVLSVEFCYFIQHCPQSLKWLYVTEQWWHAFMSHTALSGFSLIPILLFF